ncbi:MAG TPA: hypothetical protein VFF11_10375, partial [Candidatus Binatia bacterium]|nr:hypothetical protein [Candidatus Binatia bacterium]
MINRVLHWRRKMAASSFTWAVAFKYPLVVGTVLLFAFADSHAANVLLTASDGVGTSSFNSAGHWSNGVTPNAANSYFTTNYVLRSPADTSNHSFGGSTLGIDPYPGGGNVGGRLLLKGSGNAIITITNLILNGGLLDYADAANNGTKTLAGNMLL